MMLVCWQRVRASLNPSWAFSRWFQTKFVNKYTKKEKCMRFHNNTFWRNFLLQKAANRCLNIPVIGMHFSHLSVFALIRCWFFTEKKKSVGFRTIWFVCALIQLRINWSATNSLYVPVPTCLHSIQCSHFVLVSPKNSCRNSALRGTLSQKKFTIF